jgi:hypothetical protein
VPTINIQYADPLKNSILQQAVLDMLAKLAIEPVVGCSTSYAFPPSTHSGVRLDCQSAKVRTHTLSEVRVPVLQNRSFHRHGVSYRNQVSEYYSESQQPVGKSSFNSKRLEEFTGLDGSNRQVDSSGAPPHAPNTTSPGSALGLAVSAQFRHKVTSRDIGTSPVVDKSRLWSEQEQSLHSNVLELKAVFLALKAFAKFLINNPVQVATDNTTVLAYINQQGGTHSWELCALLWRILTWCHQRGISLG